ncbi:hypothetical protein TI04_09575 [Achromatium sp. WMS2]|nr:hypothetical protein TI04_09575 [Achromatium sp. WMS2]
MNYIDSVYEKYSDLTALPCYRKARKDGNFLIVMNDSLEIFYLTGVAKDIVEFIASGLKVGNLYKKLQEEYEVDPTTLKSDLLSFIKEMQWKSILSLKV